MAAQARTRHARAHRRSVGGDGEVSGVKPDVETLERLLAEIERIAAAEEEVRKLASEMKAPSTGIAVEEDRVLVGGVVVKNRGN